MSGVLSCRGITKRFPGVVALDQVDLDVAAGEIHVLLGENGAGKSTLVKILSGALAPDAGTILLDGRPVRFTSPLDAQRAGISTVYQELALVPQFTVAENILLGALPAPSSPIGRALNVVDWRQARRQAAALLQQLGASVDLDAPVRQLSVAQQQLVEIARALRFKPRLLILDEPTSSLSEDEVSALFYVIRRLADQGHVGVIFISHRLAEVFAIGSRVTVLRDGRKVGTFDLRSVDEDTLIRAMVGRDVYRTFPRRRGKPGPEVLRVEQLKLPGHRGTISFALRAGEVLGVAGLVGSGRTEMARAIFGADRPAAGRIWVAGRPVDIRSPDDAVRAGIGFVPEDRKTQGLLLEHPVRHNLTLAVLRQLAGALGVVRRRRERELASSLMERLQIRARSDLQPVSNLSGGNQQKVVLARWLASRSRVIILDEPTRGVDVAARSEIYKLIDDIAAQGVGILLISSDLSEVLGLADRILVMREGELAGELEGSTATPEAVMRLAVPAASR